MKLLMALLLPVLLSGCEVLQYAMENPDTLQFDPHRTSKSFEEKYFRYETPDPPGALPPEYIKRTEPVKKKKYSRAEDGPCSAPIPADADCRKNKSCVCSQ